LTLGIQNREVGESERPTNKENQHDLLQREGKVEFDWEPPTPFYEYDLPLFPTDSLPSWLKNFVEAESTATQTPTDLAAMLTLPLCATTLAKKIKICVKPGYIEPVNLFTVTALPPGSRKSTVFSAAIDPLEKFEAQEIERKRSQIEEAATRRRILEKALAKAENDAAKASMGQERKEHSEEAARLARELAQTPIPTLPRFLADDTTPERLSTLLRDNGGRMAVFSPEGGVFDLMGGRYSATGSPNFDVYLKGHTGDNLRVDRVGRPPEYVSSPALTLGLAVQPDVLRGLIDRPGFRGRGLLGRFLYALPKSLLGKREIDPPPVPEVVKAAYYGSVTDLLSLPFNVDQEGKPTEHILQLSPSGRAELRNFEAEIEPQLAPFGDLGSMTDWAGKLLGAVARIAAILHISEHIHYPKPWEYQIERETIDRAIRIGRYLIPHARAAYAEMGADSVVDDALHILAWIQRKGINTFTKRELYQGTKGYFKRVSALEPALELLCEHGFIREQIVDERTGPGRKPSSTFEVNPKGQIPTSLF
jgi:DNA-binding PadR family transcriptional regulator